jgi:hypothetical protein
MPGPTNCMYLDANMSNMLHGANDALRESIGWPFRGGPLGLDKGMEFRLVGRRFSGLV